MITGNLKADIKALITGEVSTLDIDREKVSRDTSLFYVKPEIVVYPKTKEDISALITYVHAAKQQGVDVSVTMRAAGTCMTGGPLSQSIVVDTTKFMNHIISVTASSAEAEPGVYYRDFEKETLKYNWLMPSYPASRELAAIGGIVSNNSGGEKTLTYGKTEKYVQGLHVVYANGEQDFITSLTEVELQNKMNEATESGRIHKSIYELISKNTEVIQAARPSVSKNSSGYYLWNVYDAKNKTFNLSKLVVGSQGTLAVVTSAVLTGVAPKMHSRMLVMFVPSTTALGFLINQRHLNLMMIIHLK
jgi:FAD/FMN-containing dehydrogenase